MNKKNYLVLSLTLFLFSSLLYSQSSRNVKPTISIRYDDIINGMTPSSAIGIIFDADEDKYTGFETNADGDEIRLIMGWKWSMIGLGTKDIDENTTVTLISLGGKYSVFDNMYTTIEYIRVDHPTVNDFIRLSLGVNF